MRSALLSCSALALGGVLLILIQVAGPRWRAPDGIVLPTFVTPECGIEEDWSSLVVDIAPAAGGAAEIRIRGRRVEGEALVEELFRVAETDRDLTDPYQPSEIFVTIRADRRLPWREVRRVVDACRDPDVRIYKVQFAVVPP